MKQIRCQQETIEMCPIVSNYVHPKETSSFFRSFKTIDNFQIPLDGHGWNSPVAYLGFGSGSDRILKELSHQGVRGAF